MPFWAGLLPYRLESDDVSVPPLRCLHGSDDGLTGHVLVAIRALKPAIWVLPMFCWIVEVEVDFSPMRSKKLSL